MDPLSDWIERQEVALGMRCLALWRWMLERIGKHAE